MQAAMEALEIVRVLAVINPGSTNPKKRIIVRVGHDPIRDSTFIDLRVAYDNGADHGIVYTKSGVRTGIEYADDIIAALQRAKKESESIRQILRAAKK